MSCYFYDAAGERTVKLTSETEMVHVNGKKVGGNDAVTKFTAYVSPYFVVSNGGAYSKHIYAASQRIASKLGNEDGFGADPRRVEQAGGKKISDFQKGNVGERFKALGYEYTAPEKEKVEKDSTMDSESEEKLIFFYHPDHLGSTSYVTDADGNIAQHVEYIPYGEVFVEERNNSFSTNYLFNAKELDNETGLYYYGARYLDPTGAMWLSVDPMWEKNIDANPYNYCHGNPINMKDPDGMNDYGLDRENGKIWLIREDTESKTDRVYYGKFRKRRTDDYNENIFIDIPKDIIKKNENGNDYNTPKGKSYMYDFGNNVEAANSFFEFAAEHTGVEWSMVESFDNNEKNSAVFTTRAARKEVGGSMYAYSKARKCKLILHVHSHPDLPQGHEDSNDLDNRRPGDDDIAFRNNAQNYHRIGIMQMRNAIGQNGGEEINVPNPIFKVYSIRKNTDRIDPGCKYRDYTR